MTNVYLRFNTAADDVNSPGRADKSAHQVILRNHGLDCPQSLVGFNRREDGFPHAPVDLGGMSGGADESVIEHAAYTKRVILCAVRTRNNVLRDNFGAMGLASIWEMKAAK